MKIYGTDGSDSLIGTPLFDIIVSGEGDDVVDAGAGDDIITDQGGSNTLRSGAGNDFITLLDGSSFATILQGRVTTNLIDAGTGDDVVAIRSYSAGPLTIDLGEGNDFLTLSGKTQRATVTLGAGRDYITLTAELGGSWQTGEVPLVITDFAAGDSGDVINFADALRRLFLTGPNAPGPNPFVGGFLSLVQDGADTVIRVDIDGTGPGTGSVYTRDIARLSNVAAGQITAYNLAGYDPAGRTPSSSVITGTTGSDRIEAGAFGTEIRGLAGDDVLIGNRGNDLLVGDAGNDVLQGGAGDDRLQGGDGDDILSDSIGNDVFDGGAGDDVISIVRRTHDIGVPAINETLVVSGGDGNDSVTISYIIDPFTAPSERRFATFTADLGAGDDVILIGSTDTSGTLTLGAGRDRAVLRDQYFGFAEATAIVITDFTAGAAGDVLDVGAVLRLTSGYNSATNPFTSGYLRLVSSGSDTLVSLDYDGSGGSASLTPLFRLVNVAPGALTAANFNGYAPVGGAILNVSLAGTAGKDTLYGGAGNDTLAGGLGQDFLSGGYGDDVLDGGSDQDTLDGGAGNDQLLGGDGDDLLQDLAAGSDTLRGGDGDDTIVVKHLYNPVVSETITIDAGAGSDSVEFTSGAIGTLTVDLGGGDDRIVLHSVVGDGSATLTLGSGSDTVVLDSLVASRVSGALTITDFATGDAGDRLDWLLFAAQKSSAPFDRYNPFLAGDARLVQAGADTLLQIKGTTVITFTATSVGAFTTFNLGVDPKAAPPSTDDTMTGTAGDDELRGTSGADIISGLDGNDKIVGEDGHDVLRGGNGDDLLYGGNGNDVLDGGAGRDTVAGDDGDDTITDLTGTDVIFGGDGDDIIAITVDSSSTIDGTGTFDAGNGNDNVVLSRDGYGTYSGALGTGDDVVTIKGLGGNVALSLGAGRDSVLLTANGVNNGGILTISDFQTGSSGDQVDIREMLNRMLTFLSGDIPADQNPFALGYAALVQSGNDVILFFNLERVPGGLNQYPVMRFANTTVAQFTADNFFGADPNAPSLAPHPIQGDLTIAAGQTDSATNVSPHFVYIGSSDGNAKFINHGLVTTTATTTNSAVGFLVNYGGSIVSAGAVFNNAADGIFRVASNAPIIGDVGDGSTYGFLAQGTNVRFANDGLFEVSAVAGTAVGVLTGYGTQGFANTNSGTINVTSGYDAYGIRFAGYDGTFTNSGTINVHGAELAVGFYADHYVSGRIINTGSIVVTSNPNSPFASIGILLFETAAKPYTHINSGAITADIAFAVTSGTNNLKISDTLINSGTIDGAIILSDGGDLLRNSGAISGRSLLGAGDDVYDGRTGTHRGSIEGGDGADTLIGGGGAESLYGDEGADRIFAGAGDDFVEGGDGGDALDGGGGFDTISYYESLASVRIDLAAGTAIAGGNTDKIRNFEQVIGSRSNDIIIGSATADVVLGANGDDVIDGGGGDDILLGNGGTDVLSGRAGRDRFLFEVGDGRDEITDFGTGDSIEIYGLKKPQSIAQVGLDVLITLNADDSILVPNTSVTALTADRLIFSSAPLGINLPTLIDQPIHVAQNLSISAGVVYTLGDVDLSTTLIARATSAPSAIALEFVNPDNTASLWNAGSVSLHTTTVGTMTLGVAPGSGGAADGGAFVNHVTGALTVLADRSDAYGTFSIGSVYNSGLIAVTSRSGSATGVYNLDIMAGSAFVNSGRIEATAATVAQGVAQAPTTSSGPTAYFNSGTITADGGLASTGVSVHFFAHPAAPQPYLVNSGTITATDDTAAVDSVGLDVDVVANGTIWNSGTISSDIALRLANSGSFSSSGFTTRIYNSGVLNGLVELGTYDDVLVNSNEINGSINLGGGNDIYDGRTGKLSGSVDGYDGDDVILAGAGDQAIHGGFGSDYLSGGVGSDVLTGGAGQDTFRFETGFGADQILDFEAGTTRDAISVGGYSAFQTLVQTGQDVLITFSATDTLLVRNAAVADVSAALSFGTASRPANVIPVVPDAPVAPTDPLPVANSLAFLSFQSSQDFNGDYASDVLFRSGTGLLASWQLGGSAPSGGGNIGNPGSSNRLVAVVDIDGDGRADLLFRGRDGTIAAWQIDGTAITRGGTIGNPGPAYTLVGTGDFNGDGKSDALFRNGLTGSYASWNLDGTAIVGGGTIGNPGAGYVFKAIGDFDGNGTSDLLFQNVNGTYATWSLDDTAITGGGNLGNPGPAWFFKGTGDFNGDGKTDVLFQNADGRYATWNLDGTAIIGGGNIGNPGAAWSLDAIGDYNGDGKSDLLFRNVNGTVATWTLSGTQIIGGATLGSPGSAFSVATGHGADTFTALVFQSGDGTVASWLIGSGVNVGGGNFGNPGPGLTAKAVADFAGTGGTDVLFQASDGAITIWKTDGSRLIGGGAIGNPGVAYTVKAVGDFNGDGKSDILFQHANGSYATWNMSGTTIIGGGAIGVAAGYTFVAAGDLNGDGKSDMLFKDASGSYAAWLIDDTAIAGGGTIGNPGAGFTFAGLGDFNGDGNADLLFKAADGTFASWDMDGTAIIGGGNIGDPGGTFTLATLADINGDGKTDFVFADASGNYAAWLIDDTHILQGVNLGNAGTDFHVI